MLPCAGAYVSGAAGSNECPAGSVRIEAEAACRAAAAAAGKTAASAFVETDSAYPRGCYYYTGSGAAFFNTHAVGAGRSGSQLLCAAAAATTGAPPLMPLSDARTCTPARAAALRGCACVPHAHVCDSCGRHGGAIALCGLRGVAATAQRCGMGTGSVCMCAE